jgi:hypothetical protein
VPTGVVASHERGCLRLRFRTILYQPRSILAWCDRSKILPAAAKDSAGSPAMTCGSLTALVAFFC